MKARQIFRTAAIALSAAIATAGFTACDDGLEIQQTYPFTVETMPVRKDIVKGETAEIRCTLHREGRYDDARTLSAIFRWTARESCVWTTGRCSHPMTAIRSRERSSGSTTPPHLPTSRPSTSISRTTGGSVCNSLFSSATRRLTRRSN